MPHAGADASTPRVTVTAAANPAQLENLNGNNALIVKVSYKHQHVGGIACTRPPMPPTTPAPPRRVNL